MSSFSKGVGVPPIFFSQEYHELSLAMRPPMGKECSVLAVELLSGAESEDLWHAPVAYKHGVQPDAFDLSE
jgi:hypothetical protein